MSIFGDVKQAWKAFGVFREVRKMDLSKLKSRKLWAAVIGAAIQALGHGLGLSMETIDGIVQLIMAYILAQAAVDMGGAVGEGVAKAKKLGRMPGQE